MERQRLPMLGVRPNLSPSTDPQQPPHERLSAGRSTENNGSDFPKRPVVLAFVLICNSEHVWDVFDYLRNPYSVQRFEQTGVAFHTASQL
jgi:hypothetical protein